MVVWEEYNVLLYIKVDILNEKRFVKFYYKVLGIDLIIEFFDKYIWVGVGSINEDGNLFMVNMLIEEVFIFLKKDGVNG